MTSWLSEETWSQLDPNAGRLRGRARIVLAVALTAAIALASTAVAAGRSGLFAPRINADLERVGATPRSNTIIETFALSTSNGADDHVTGVAASGPGAHVAALTALPAKIPGSGMLAFTVRITVTDCAEIGDRGLRVVVDFHRFWGTASKTIGPTGGLNDPSAMLHDVLQDICD